jgi:hypothetical protein
MHVWIFVMLLTLCPGTSFWQVSNVYSAQGPAPDFLQYAGHFSESCRARFGGPFWPPDLGAK